MFKYAQIGDATMKYYRILLLLYFLVVDSCKPFYDAFLVRINSGVHEQEPGCERVSCADDEERIYVFRSDRQIEPSMIHSRNASVPASRASIFFKSRPTITISEPVAFLKEEKEPLPMLQG
jgi:hypothetical protein